MNKQRKVLITITYNEMGVIIDTKTEELGSSAQLGTDCISRQAAIDALDEIEAEVADGYGYQYAKWREYFVEMPSAQPEIIRCRDCRHNNNCDIQYHAQAGDMFFCAAAERRTDG